MRNTKLQFDQLEARVAPVVTLVGGLLSVSIDTPGGTHTVQAENGTNPGDVLLKIDGAPQLISGVTALQLQGAKGAINVIENATSIPGTEIGVGSRDTLFGGFGPDTLIAGHGKEIIYDLFATNTINAVNNKADFIVTNPASMVMTDPTHLDPAGLLGLPYFPGLTSAPAKDTVVTFFAPGRTVGSGTAVLDHGTLYLSPPNQTTAVTTLTEAHGSYVLNTNWIGTKVFAKNTVQQVAYFGGGPGANQYTNDTHLSDIVYGGSGSDVLVGGMGQITIFKGLAGSDVLVGRASYVDLSNGVNSVPDNAADTLVALGVINVTRAGPEDTVLATNLAIALLG